MKPLRLIIQDFGSYRDKTEIDFTLPNQNLFLITGDTGAGKTTIFDAIVFALYGEASSGINKKEGLVLQSQFSDYRREPYVVFEFSQGNKVYTVRRVPRHRRKLTRGAEKGVGIREVSGSVALQMPDGTEYPAKEADRKLAELLGLTKEQFMQIAMIAQGEFMQLLRAKSDDKKVIFRKLFHTQKYQKIVDELGERRRQTEKELEALKTKCQTIVSRVEIPSDYVYEKELSDGKNAIVHGDIEDLLSFTDRLGNLCDELLDIKRKADQCLLRAHEDRDQKRDERVKAKSISKFYEQLDEADNELAKCDAIKDTMINRKQLIRQIQDAYELQMYFNSYNDLKNQQEEMASEIKKLQTQMPELRENLDFLTAKKTDCKQQFDAATQKYNKIQERVAKAKDVFEKIKQIEKMIGIQQQKTDHLEQIMREEKKMLTELEQNEAELNAKGQSIGELAAKYLQWEVDLQDTKRFKEQLMVLSALWDNIKELKQEVSEKQKTYELAKEKFLLRQEIAEQARQDYLDAQAGFLAQELENGKPCPVCGSLIHPNPCQSPYRQEDLTKEKVDQLIAEAKELQKDQQHRAEQLGSICTMLAEREKRWREDLRKAFFEAEKRDKLSQDGSADEVQLSNLQDWNDLRLQKLTNEGRNIADAKEELKKIEEQQRYLEAQKKQKMSEIESAAHEYADQKERLAGEKASLVSLKNIKIYRDEVEAESILSHAKNNYEKKRSAYQKTKEEFDLVLTKHGQSEILCQRYQDELPKLTKSCEKKNKNYLDAMKQKEISEKQWKDLVAIYTKEDADRMRTELEEYSTRRKSAAVIKKSAQKAIGTEARPNLSLLLQLEQQSQSCLEQAQKEQEKWKALYQSDLESVKRLKEIEETQSEAVRTHQKIDNLYRLLSGKVSGSRMDIETFAQRHYLERILNSANHRLYQMTAGEFEFRMLDLDNAGIGKNRGLDLMIYSNMTGQEREIRTLSGGESFMAALSLALGMADQIQENTSSIHLDMMFIDEGFGSLDQYAREQAVKVLLSMAVGEKLIGIISHVSELKQELENQLIVCKDENGSHVKWKIS